MDVNEIYSRFQDLYKNTFFKLILITLIITIYLIIDQVFFGVPYYDVYVYLNNALIFAGNPVGNLSVIYLSPLMPFLTSLFFRIGFISVHTIFVLDGIVLVFGVIGLYLLFRERFNEIQSAVGCLIFLSFPLIYSWAVSGGIDVPGVSFSIWVIYLLVRGVRENSKSLYLVFPLLSVAFLVRYTSIILIFPIFLYLLINENFLNNIKKIGIGFLASLILIIPFLTYFYVKLGNLNSLINILTSNITGSGGALIDQGYNPDRLYYLTHLLNYISVDPITRNYGIILNPSNGFPSILSYITVGVLVLGLGIYLYQILLKWNKQGINDSNKNKNYYSLIMVIFLLAVGVFSFFINSFIVTEFIILLALFFGYTLLKKINFKNLDIDFLLLSWFAAFFIFHSVISLKTDRYFITMIPALAYFIILAFSVIIEKYKFKFKQVSLRSWGFYVIVGLIFISFNLGVHSDNAFVHGSGYTIQGTSNWLEKYDPNYKNENIYSNDDPAYTWGLKKEVIIGVPSLYISTQSFSNYLIGNNADYYIDAFSEPKLNIPGYHIIKNISTTSIYQRNTLKVNISN
ncbi:MAG: glycosyltransferase family 39 protein [Methanobacterium sp.]